MLIVARAWLYTALVLPSPPPFLSSPSTIPDTDKKNSHTYIYIAHKQLWRSHFQAPWALLIVVVFNANTYTSTLHSLIHSLPQVFRLKFVSFCKRTCVTLFYLYLTHVHFVLSWLHATFSFSFLFFVVAAEPFYIFIYLFIPSYYIVVLLL